ncbi:hypothetical protein Q5425_05085 [Amycolatopsis sp. A133]|uniref:hypothetical protein n=1 Tax=Amycolatopsis sp. A133 TaxID=3064472 RepID=UPI0027F2356E|nr:hypothetical protein [Amycolatopsis sp. A133]MDQ7803091.1 hypothetical protein [Amycolatopsis sp. A133]
MDSALFSHPVAEEPRPGALAAPQSDRYGSLFRQPVYTPEPAADGETTPGPQRRHRAATTRAHDPSGRRGR